MKRIIVTLALLFVPAMAPADTTRDVIRNIVDAHILPRIDTLADRSQALSDTAKQDCTPISGALRSAYGAAFDAWVSVSHLRFGPTEVDDRAFALAFWPDSRGATPKALSSLLAAQDPVASSPQDYGQVSIAARGFYALEFLLYDDAYMTAENPDYHCQLVQTISADIALTARQIKDDWHDSFAAVIQNPTATGRYRSDDEALKEVFKALSTGLQFTSETRLGRPLGTFDRPRPKRAEARRSGRSSRHVRLSLTALQDIATRLAADNTALSATLEKRFIKAMAQLSKLKDPTFESVSVMDTRFRVEIVQQSIDAIRSIVRDELGPTLGVAAGFNALDGD